MAHHRGGRHVEKKQALAIQDLKEVLFDNITSSIEIPGGAGYSTYYADPSYGGISWAFYATKTDLGPYGLDNMISSVGRGLYRAP